MDFAVCRRALIALLAGLLIQTSHASTSPSTNINPMTGLEAINQAAWQRTLVMRIAKSHMMVAAGVDYQKSKTQLTQSIGEYESVLKLLQSNSPNRDISDRLKAAKGQWKQFKAAALATPTKENAVTVIEESDDLLYHTDAVVRHWRAFADEQPGHLVDTSSQQGMLSERIGMFYAAHFMV